MAARKVLIFGATGKQGSAVVDQCMRMFPDDEVHAVTRNANSTRAQSLAKSGVKILEGDMNKNDGALGEKIKALQPTHVFLMSNERSQVVGSRGKYVAEEIESARRIIKCLEQIERLEYVVMTSVSGCDDGITHGVPSFTAKAVIESVLASSSIANWTILRLTTLMDNFKDKELGGMTSKSITGLANNAHMSMWYVSCHDVGVAAAKLFAENSSNYSRKIVNCASEYLTGKEIAAAYATATNASADSIKYKPLLSPTMMKLPYFAPDYVAMHKYWLKHGYPITSVDTGEFSALVGKPLTMESYFRSIV